MSERTDSRPAKKAAQSQPQDANPHPIDANATLSEHMYNFVYETNRQNEVGRQLAGQTTVSDRNIVTIANLQHQSDNVRQSLQYNAMGSAERSQVRAVALTNQIDLGGISLAISANAGKPENEAAIAFLKNAGAAPLVERVRLGYIQMNHESETDAEVTFENAYRADIAKESKDLPEVVMLKTVAQVMAVELKIRRTLPELFEKNYASIDAIKKDGVLTRDELQKSAEKGVGDPIAKEFVGYLLKNFERIKNGDDAITRADILKFHSRVKLTGMPRV